MSIRLTNKLNEAERRLREVGHQISPIVDQHHKSMEAAQTKIEDYVCRTRQLCVRPSG